jgi:hypothetical protein
MLETDYLVIGAGAMGLAFADELLTRTDARITIVDKRHAPGGHWNDAYAFVRLHQPSIFYGVESKELAEYRIDTSGPNRGFLSLAEGSEIVHYFHSLMRDRFLPSGRVSFLPMCEVQTDGTLRSLLSGECRPIHVHKKTVNAAYLTNVVPQTHTRKFAVAAGVACIPPNDLPRLAPRYARFTVLGAGKTGVDTCCWLLAHGATADSIRWIMPRDSWFVNRATTQPGPEFFEQAFGSAAAMREALAAASSARDFAHRVEATGAWLRLDSNIEPGLFHAATLSTGELQELKRIANIVRLGRAVAIEPERMLLERGELSADPNTLYIDCTASALQRPPSVPVFAGDRITLQMVRFPQLPFSAALIGFLESTSLDDAAKNQLIAPLRISDTVEEYIVELATDFANRQACGKHREVRAWISSSRTDGFSRVLRDIDQNDSAKLAILARVREATAAAALNLPRLLAAL